jgi:adenylate cyclase
MAAYATPEQEWHDFLNGTHPHLHEASPLRLIPSNPRCRLCKAPFGGPGGRILRRYGYSPWAKNPKICGRCFQALGTHAQMCPTAPGEQVHGAEVEISMLFADVRGSSRLARQMPTFEFTRLMQRFYGVSTDVLVEHDAIVEKFVGDEVVGLFVPFLTGPGHARRAVETAEALLRATGHGSQGGPWVPLGAGVHTGMAFVGIVVTESSADFTALGDPVNLAAHLASEASAGEVLVTDETLAGAGLSRDGFARRSVSLKGVRLEASVLSPS